MNHELGLLQTALDERTDSLIDLYPEHELHLQNIFKNIVLKTTFGTNIHNNTKDPYNVYFVIGVLIHIGLLTALIVENSDIVDLNFSSLEILASMFFIAINMIASKNIRLVHDLFWKKYLEIDSQSNVYASATIGSLRVSKQVVIDQNNRLANLTNQLDESHRLIEDLNIRLETSNTRLSNLENQYDALNAEKSTLLKSILITKSFILNTYRMQTFEMRKYTVENIVLKDQMKKQNNLNNSLMQKTNNFKFNSRIFTIKHGLQLKKQFLFFHSATRTEIKKDTANMMRRKSI